MNLFEIRDGKLAVTEHTLSVASMRAIWEHDKSKKKESAMDSFTLIYHMHHPKSPYQGYDDADREAAIRKNELKSVVRPSKMLAKATEDFIRFRDEAAPIFSLYTSAQGALYKVRQYFDDIDLSKEGFDIKALVDTLKKVPDIVKAFSYLEEQIEKQEFTTTKTRGNREINDFEK